MIRLFFLFFVIAALLVACFAAPTAGDASITICITTLINCVNVASDACSKFNETRSESDFQLLLLACRGVITAIVALSTAIGTIGIFTAANLTYLLAGTVTIALQIIALLGQLGVVIVTFANPQVVIALLYALEAALNDLIAAITSVSAIVGGLAAVGCVGLFAAIKTCINIYLTFCTIC